MPAAALRSLGLALLAGLLLLAGGVIAGAALLPAGRAGDLLPRQRYVAVFEALARRQQVELASAPRQRRGLLVEVVQGAQWSAAQGQLELTFSTGATPVGVQWVPSTIGDFVNPRATQPEGICGLLLGPGESLGPAVPWVGTAQAAVTVATITGSAPPEHVFRLDPPGGSVLCMRRPGDARAELRILDVGGGFADWPAYVPVVLFGLAAVLLFVALAFRARIDLWNAALIGGVFLLSCLLGDWPIDMGLVIAHGVVVPAAAVFLLVLWAAAESWGRSHLPEFTTTLDTLRRGRLGARAGRELVLGWAGGAGLAGLRLLLLAGATALPGMAPAALAAPVPLFGPAAHPLRHGVMWTAALLLALTAGQLRTPRARWLLLPLVPLVVAPVALVPWWAGYLAGTVATAGLLLVLLRGGLTAALLAATLAYWLPTAALAARYPRWLPVTLAASLLALLAPLVAGGLGLARGAAVERDPGAVPEFVRREERERRVSYEMDLLARMQLGLLPHSLPRLAGYEVTARSLLATEAGGDLYDFLRDERGRIWVAAGDVSGHGYSCAIGQASLKASLHSLVDAHATPARVLERMDRVLRGSVGVRMFATLALICLEEATGRVVLANAGHPFPVLVEPRAPAREIELPGLPLGQGPPRRYRDVELVLPRGGILLLFSDGLYEATDPAGQPYGFDRPREVLAAASSWNAAEVLERLIYDWRQHLAGSPSLDDTTLVVLKRL